MQRNAQGLIGAATAALIALSAAVLAAQTGEDAPTTAVLGRQVERTTTTTTAAVASSTTSVPVTAPVVVVETTTTTAVPGTTSTTVRRTTTSSPQPVGRAVEVADRSSWFDYRPDGAGTMSTSDSATPVTRSGSRPSARTSTTTAWPSCDRRWPTRPPGTSRFPRGSC